MAGTVYFEPAILMSDRQTSPGPNEAEWHADSGIRRELWDAAEAALEAVTPALWQMALTANALLDVKPDATQHHPRRAIRKPQVEGEVAVVFRIERRSESAPATLADLHCRVGRQWSFLPRWFRRTRKPVWRDLAVFDLDTLSGASPPVIDDVRTVVTQGIRTRAAR